MTTREEMIEQQLKGRDIRDPKVLQAMREVDRRLFVPDELQHRSYEDNPLPIGKSQTISQPYIVAYMAQQLELKENDKVLEIGTGCGYNAAVLSRIAEEVYSTEIIEWLANVADANLKKTNITNVHSRCGDGYEGWPEAAPFDAIELTAAPPKIPETLKKQLKIGGRLLAPVGEAVQRLVLVRRTGEHNFIEETLHPVRFVPMTGKPTADKTAGSRVKQHNPPKAALSLMQNFARKTGLEYDAGTPERRYLWTDAFALMNFTALHESTGSPLFRDNAEKLVRLVHHTLGRFDENDSRQGWIRGAGEQNSEEHPTVAGLRIGKKMPERKHNENPDPQLEWERDGQYFHYHTRWINALITAGKHFENEWYTRCAADLSLAGAHFIEKTAGQTSMYWKMSVDLSRPLVPIRGAHDSLEGLLSAYRARNAAESRLPEFENYISQLKGLCDASGWLTNDPLGLGGLLIDVIHAAELKATVDLPDAAQPQVLLEIAEQGLSDFMSDFNPDQPPAYRLAFRECGLSLGIRVLDGHRDFLSKKGVVVGMNSEIRKMADQIENFWLNAENRRERSFIDHRDINEVSLASSLLARNQPEIYGRN